MHPGFNIIMRLNTTKQWMRLMWQYDTSVIIALRLKLSMTVWQKNRQTRLAIFCVKKHKFLKPAQGLGVQHFSKYVQMDWQMKLNMELCEETTEYVNSQKERSRRVFCDFLFAYALLLFSFSPNFPKCDSKIFSTAVFSHFFHSYSFYVS